jgi:hypothetical protein
MNCRNNGSPISRSPFCRCTIYILLLFPAYLTHSTRKLQYAENKWPAYQHALLCIIQSHRMLLFPVMAVSLVHLGPGESSWSSIIGTGTSYLSDTNSNPRQFMHCFLANADSWSSIQLYQLLLRVQISEYVLVVGWYGIKLYSIPGSCLTHPWPNWHNSYGKSVYQLFHFQNWKSVSCT